jgi:hypothetical protein
MAGSSEMVASALPPLLSLRLSRIHPAGLCADMVTAAFDPGLRRDRYSRAYADPKANVVEANYLVAPMVTSPNPVLCRDNQEATTPRNTVVRHPPLG